MSCSSLGKYLPTRAEPRANSQGRANFCHLAGSLRSVDREPLQGIKDCRCTRNGRTQPKELAMNLPANLVVKGLVSRHYDLGRESLPGTGLGGSTQGSPLRGIANQALNSPA